MLGNNHSLRTGLKFRLSIVLGNLPFKRGRQGGPVRAAADSSTNSVGWAQNPWGCRLMKSATLALALISSASIALADLKITTKSASGGQSITSTTYIKGARQRTEGMGYTIIYQCDLKRMIQINDKTKAYLITPLAGGDGSKPTSPQGQNTNARRGGVITYTTTTTDTTERKQMLGLTAKHMKSKTVVEASEGACASMNMELETDGWYADLPTGQNCLTEGTSSLPLDQSDCVDEVRYKTEGAANSGYPILTTTTIKFNTGGGDGPSIPPSSSTQEVTDISTLKLDSSLFEIPAGYTEAKTSQELGSPY